MKNLSEEEILQCLHHKIETIDISYDEITNPDYEVWGRAREWEFHQAACLFAKLSPIAKPYFDILTSKSSFLNLLHWVSYYPVQIKDRTRLQNISRLLEEFPLMAQVKKTGRSIRPKELLDLCKKHQGLAPFLPSDLIEVIDCLGPHPSLDLPNTFSSLEINPSELESLKKFKEKEKKPVAINIVIRETELPKTLPTPPIPPESPIVIAKKLFPLQDLNRWKKAETLSLYEIVLLHYEIEPVDVLTQPLAPLPYRSESQNVKELIGYLSRYFFGSVPIFIQTLDINHIFDLIGRALQAQTLQSFESVQFPHMIYFVKDEIICWMKAKSLAFPIHNLSDVQTPEKISETSKENLLSYDLKRLDKDQLAKLIARSVAAILWKVPKLHTLQQIRKHTYFQKALALIQAIIEKKEPFDEKTIEDWIRNLNPNYKPKK